MKKLKLEIFVFCLTETHIKVLDTLSFLNELTPEDFSLVHTTKKTNVVAVLPFLLNQLLPHLLFNFLKIFCHTWIFCLRYPPLLLFFGDFNFHVNTMSPTVSELKSIIDSCCLSQYIDFSTHLHGHTLDLLMAASKFSAIFDVKGSGLISDHKIISCVVDFPSLDTPMQKDVTFRQYHKLNIDKFRIDRLAFPFIKSPSDDFDLLHEQYMSFCVWPSRYSCTGED